MPALIGTAIVVMLIVATFGWEGLLALLIIMLLYGVVYIFLRGIKRAFEYVKGAIVAAMTFGAVRVPYAILFGDEYKEYFWAAYAAALVGVSIYVYRVGCKERKEAQPYIEKLRVFAENYAHFMEDHIRSFVVYGDKHSIKVEMRMVDLEDYERTSCRDIDDLMSRYFGPYTPAYDGAIPCYQMLQSGKRSEYSNYITEYTWTLAYDKAYFLPYLAKEMKTLYPGKYRWLGSDTFSVQFLGK